MPSDAAIKFEPRRLKFVNRRLLFLLLAILSSSIATGILLGMFGRGPAQAAFSAFIPGHATDLATGTKTCH